MATFKVQQRFGTLWEQVGRCRSWERALKIIGQESDGPGWFVAEDERTRVHLREDAEWRIVETGFGPPAAPAADRAPDQRVRRYGAFAVPLVTAVVLQVGGLSSAAAEDAPDPIEQTGRWVVELIQGDSGANSSPPYIQHPGADEW